MTRTIWTVKLRCPHYLDNHGTFQWELTVKTSGQIYIRGLRGCSRDYDCDHYEAIRRFAVENGAKLVDAYPTETEITLS